MKEFLVNLIKSWLGMAPSRESDKTLEIEAQERKQADIITFLRGEARAVQDYDHSAFLGRQAQPVGHLDRFVPYHQGQVLRAGQFYFEQAGQKSKLLEMVSFYNVARFSRYSVVYLVADPTQGCYKLGSTKHLSKYRGKTGDGKSIWGRNIANRMAELGVVTTRFTWRQGAHLAIYPVTNSQQHYFGNRDRTKWDVARVVEDSFRKRLGPSYMQYLDVDKDLRWVAKLGRNVPNGYKGSGESEWRWLQTQDGQAITGEVFETEMLKIARTLDSYITSNYSLGRKNKRGYAYERLTDLI